MRLLWISNLSDIHYSRTIMVPSPVYSNLSHSSDPNKTLWLQNAVLPFIMMMGKIASWNKGFVTPVSLEPPVQILVQTLTHLVPRNDRFNRIDLISDRICHYHWNCNFTVPKFRWAPDNAQIGLNNRRCFALVNYGKSQNDDDVPVMSYNWTDESL